MAQTALVMIPEVKEDGYVSTDDENRPLLSGSGVGAHLSWSRSLVCVLAVLGLVATTFTDKKTVQNPTSGNAFVDSITVLDEVVDPNTCASEDMVDTNGEGYRGCQNVAVDGRVCQAWYRQVPNPHHYLPHVYATAGIGYHNYCRNPSKSDGIWCYVVGGGTFRNRWAYCQPLKTGETSAPTEAPPATLAPTQVPPTTEAETQAPPTTSAHTEGPTQAPPTTLAETQAPPTTSAQTGAPPTSLTPPVEEDKNEDEDDDDEGRTPEEEEEEEEKEDKEEQEQAEEGEDVEDGSDCFEKGIIYVGCKRPKGPKKWRYVGYALVKTPEECQQKCQGNQKCNYFVHFRWRCFLKSSRGECPKRITRGCLKSVVSGMKTCPGDEGSEEIRTTA